MKEQILIEMRNKIERLANIANQLIKVVQQLLDENAYLKDLAVGTLETIKLMDDYEDAIEKLRTKVAEERSKAEEAKPLETPSN